jgi:hypothetical protein
VLFQPGIATWLIFTSSSGFTALLPPGPAQWGAPGDIPLSGDSNGDGRSDLIVWRPSIGQWFINFSTNFNTSQSVALGQLGDIPLTGRFGQLQHLPVPAVGRPAGHPQVKDGAGGTARSLAHQAQWTR